MPFHQASTTKTIEVSTIPPEVSIIAKVYVKGTDPPQPVKGARVTPKILLGVDPQTGEEQWWRLEAKRVSTDALGVALVYELGPQFYAVEVSHTDYRTAEIRDINLVDYLRQEVTVELEPLTAEEKMKELLQKLWPLAIIFGGVFGGVYAISKA